MKEEGNQGVALHGNLGLFEAKGSSNMRSYRNGSSYENMTLKGITLGRHKSDYNNRMIQLTYVFCILIKNIRTSSFLLQLTADSINRDPIKRRALY